MVNPQGYIEIVMNTNIDELQVGDWLNVDINIKNKSEFMLDNGLFRLTVDEGIFNLLDNNFEGCINDYGSIGTVNPNSMINISIPLKVKNIPQDLISQVYCDVNFNFINDSSIIEDISCKSKFYSIFFAHPYTFSKDDFKYYVDKTEVFENDIVNHTIEINNNSKVDIKELLLYNISKTKFEFVCNSLKINGMYQMDGNVLQGIHLDELECQENLKIEFKTKTLKALEDINFRFCIEYKVRQHNITQKSENVNLKMMYPLISINSFIKNPSKYSAYIGDIIEFKIEVANIGTSDAVNVIIKDKIDNSLEYMENSLYIDYVRDAKSSLFEGIKIKRLKPNEKKIITYRAKAININANRKSNAICIYSNYEGASPISVKSNCSEIIISGAKIGNNNIKKEFSTNHLQLGDIVSVCIEVDNTGNIDCESIKIQDEINNCIEFIENSLKINGAILEGADIYNGVCIDRLEPQKQMIVTYQLKVVNIPKPNPIIDKTILSYNYLHNNVIKSKYVSSQKTKLYVYNPNLYIEDRAYEKTNETLIKLCNKDEYLYFNLILENKGNIGLENIFFRMNFPEELNIDYKSLIVNNSSYNKIIDNKIILPNLNVSQQSFINFKAKYSYIKDYNLDTTMYFEYEFKDLDRKNTYKNIKKFKHNILVVNAELEISKSLSHKEIYKDEEFTQSIVIKNIGNIRCENLKINLNQSEYLNKKAKKYFLNGKEIPKFDILNLGELDVEDIINIDINYMIDHINEYDEIINESYLSATYNSFENEVNIIDTVSNKLKLKLKNPSIDIVGKCNYDVLFVGQKYKYIYNIFNDGNIDFEELKIKINAPKNIEYVKDSFKIDGESRKIESLYLSIDIEEVKVKHFINVSFDFIVNDIDENKNLELNAIVDAKYKVDNNNISKNFYSKDKELVVENKSLDIIKCASHEYLQKGDKLKIQNILNNTGTIDFYNIKIIDNNEVNLNFIKDSVYIDGENICEINPIDGINIDKLSSLDNVLISYEYEYLPKKYASNITHFSDIEYSYAIKNCKPKYEKQTSQKIYIEGGASTFKQFNIENKYVLESNEPDICDIVSAYTDAKIDRIHEVNTIAKQSIDNYNSTGKKVIIKGTVMNRVEYLIKEHHSSLYLLEKQHPFTISINIPIDYYSEDIDFKVKPEDVFCKKNNKRSIYISTLISIEGLI